MALRFNGRRPPRDANIGPWRVRHVRNAIVCMFCVKLYTSPPGCRQPIITLSTLKPAGRRALIWCLPPPKKKRGETQPSPLETGAFSASPCHLVCLHALSDTQVNRGGFFSPENWGHLEVSATFDEASHKRSYSRTYSNNFPLSRFMFIPQ